MSVSCSTLSKLARIAGVMGRANGSHVTSSGAPCRISGVRVDGVAALSAAASWPAAVAARMSSALSGDVHCRLLHPDDRECAVQECDSSVFTLTRSRKRFHREIELNGLQK